MRIVSWNVENLFDTIDDAGFRDEEFLPTGERRWTGGRYWHKLTDVARVLAAMADSNGVPDLIGLVEVENDSVLTTLVRRSSLRQMGYEYVMTHSQDSRGIDVALLFQPARFRLIEYNCINVHARGKNARTTRDILYAKGLVKVDKVVDTLHVIIVHLPSKAGGRAGDNLRRQAATTLWALVDSIKFNYRLSRACSGNTVSAEEVAQNIEEEPRIVVIGDFNATARDQIFQNASLRFADDTKEPGTYSFRGYWQWIDHVFLSSSVVPVAPARPFSMPWMLEDNLTYGGMMPYRTYRGPIYHGGISDHLPVVVDVSFK
ncbi:MAG: endonuclease/exonuclease/phosphatase family protein [Bacteroidaceae bacterium]|nr:endonuclease/exonuclease/phosphatase family protein [Bacteroidaceae bacterium]